MPLTPSDTTVNRVSVTDRRWAGHTTYGLINVWVKYDAWSADWETPFNCRDWPAQTAGFLLQRNGGGNFINWTVAGGGAGSTISMVFVPDSTWHMFSFALSRQWNNNFRAYYDTAFVNEINSRNMFGDNSIPLSMYARPNAAGNAPASYIADVAVFMSTPAADESQYTHVLGELYAGVSPLDCSFSQYLCCYPPLHGGVSHEPDVVTGYEYRCSLDAIPSTAAPEQFTQRPHVHDWPYGPGDFANDAWFENPERKRWLSSLGITIHAGEIVWSGDAISEFGPALSAKGEMQVSGEGTLGLAPALEAAGRIEWSGDAVIEFVAALRAVGTLEWSGEATFILDGDLVGDEYVLAITADPPGGAIAAFPVVVFSPSPDDDELVSPQQCNFELTYEAETEVTLTAPAADPLGYKWDGWWGDDGRIQWDKAYTFSVTDEATIIAHYTHTRGGLLPRDFVH